MITITQNAVGNEPAKFFGLSTDTKPTVSVPNGAEFNEIDTGKKYLFSADGAKWYQQPVQSGGNSGGGNGIPNWNQNDPDGEGYIQNRPFYEEGEMVEVLAECQPVYSEDAGFVISDSELPLVVGETYVVKWNGTEYSCVAQSLSALGGGVGLGDLSAFAELDANLTGNGEPFAVMAVGLTVCAWADGSADPVTISIYHDATVIHHLDGKYLPEGVGYIEEGMVEVLAETTLTVPENESTGEFYIAENFTAFVIGETYMVNWNGVEYTGTAFDASMMMGEGAVCVVNDGADLNTGEGAVFMLCNMSNGEETILYISDPSKSLSVTISIYHNGATVHKMDERCLPDTLFVNVDFAAMTADKTTADIWAAIQNKQNVLLVVGSGSDATYNPCLSCMPSKGAFFAAVSASEDSGEITKVTGVGAVCVKPDGSVIMG